ncbi:chemotaxis protein CheB [Belliella aquatica]|uniref:Chemotaxis protein CheR n=1 Tax=Belliella aquatica TaxID=1323734 RepID=A0ABQ1N314_9BACT|nr:chemotaxis protein CheB [Belliella aquatica]MCH7403994.1 ATP-binding protein [Belliella aquatica]GGC50007.1 chemotaxis protein CheR [Belliella aquatica]
MIQKTQQTETSPFIIAIGASAGGMEAIHLLFDHTPEDGVAYIIIQHLSPDHKSFMAELLAHHSKLEIFVVEDGMPVKPNRVYLMPKGKNMTIRNRTLYLSEVQTRQPNTAIDIFFDSLAKDVGEKSIAIILSGTGTDGTKGITSIKKNGGFVIVQDPESAKFNGMPNSAIESGNVDLVRPPELIPEEIIAHLSQGLLENNFNTQITEKDDAELLRILQMIQEHTPFDFSEYKRPTIIRRIVKRMTKSNITTLKEYGQFLEANPEEINILAKEFLISVTKFFRDKEAFDLIKGTALKEIIDNKLQVDTLKAWVVGCATGEEAYSLAILILEELTELKKNLEVKIFASDIDKAALQHASKGIYSEFIEREVSQERLEKYFIKEGNNYKIRDNVRKMIIFAEHDIVKQPPYGKIDLISCRNLLIYINPILQRKILASLHFCLNLGGYLFLGPSESLGDLKKSFVEVDKKWKLYKSIEVVRNLRNTTYSTPGLGRQMINLNLSSTPPKSLIKSNLTELINSTLLEESGYQAGIWVDTNFEIIQTSGDFEKFLLPKIFNFNLLEMLPRELAIATSTTLKKAVSSNQKIIIEQVKFKKEDVIRSVNVLIKPFLSEKKTIEDVVLVLFSENEKKEISEDGVEVFEVAKHTERYFEDMKAELVETKSKLKDAFDALEVSNDNISSYNEELISGNEEMQSTNEELQSVNEELQTVNIEYQTKIKELAELNDDLNNYFKSTINAQLYVDKNLILRKFTPSAILQINLKESDLGRLISDISTNIRFSTLMDDIAKVVSTSETIEKEVQTLDGKWYQMAGIPYIKQQDNQKDGAIITFNDITELKKVQEKLSRINQDHDTFIYSVSHDLKGPLNNLRSLITILEDSIEITCEEDQEVMDMIMLSTTNLASIINELTDIVKIENEIDILENINVEDMLNEIEASMKDKLVLSNAKINLDLKISEIPFSKKNMRSILTNILSNAIKYCSPDRAPEVSFSTDKVGNQIILSVKDNGLGIPENKKQEIFARFKRAHNHVEGSGVGLFLIKKIINLAGGDIEVESELGKGSTFKVYFKCDDAA